MVSTSASRLSTHYRKSRIRHKVGQGTARKRCWSLLTAPGASCWRRRWITVVVTTVSQKERRGGTRFSGQRCEHWKRLWGIYPVCRDRPCRCGARHKPRQRRAQSSRERHSTVDGDAACASSDDTPSAGPLVARSQRTGNPSRRAHNCHPGGLKEIFCHAKTIKWRDSSRDGDSTCGVWAIRFHPSCCHGTRHAHPPESQ